LSGNYYFPGFVGKPSEKIKEILDENAVYGLKDIFYGMRDDLLVS
jgi:hypothetical protein